ncbi:MAG: PLP-dependent transferase [Patescibacteria group bacterium]|nr:PLP-dependent transferase [Patescibacteria group bacterium]
MSEKISTPHSPESWNEEFAKHRAGQGADVYARSGYGELREFEKEIAAETGAADAAVFNAGMAAIHTAIEAEELRAGEVVLASDKVYSATAGLFEDLKKRGVKVEIIKPEDTAGIIKKIEELQPSAIILESVANAKEMRMADLGKIIPAAEAANKKYQTENTPAALLDKRLATAKFSDKYADLGEEEKKIILAAINEFQETSNYFCLREAVRKVEGKIPGERKEIIKDLADMVKYVGNNERDRLNLIIDNTLPSAKLYDALGETKGEMVTNMVVVESGTKHYQSGADKITMGLAYSKNPEKIKAIKKERTRLGTYLQPSSLKEIPPDSLAIMKERMDLHAKNALGLAKELNDTGKAIAYHPNLAGHPDKELADSFAPQGIVTVFYLELKDISADEFARRAFANAQGKIKIGVGFGHNETWLTPLSEKTVRISAGIEIGGEAETVAASLKKALE